MPPLLDIAPANFSIERRWHNTIYRLLYPSQSLQSLVKSLRYRALLRRSAMRVCQPGPVAFQRAMTSAGSRNEINLRGLDETGLPPFFTLARESISVVRCGSSSYSFAAMTWASTFARSDFKERRDAGFFALISFPHAKYVSRRTTRRVPDYDQSVA